MIVLKTNNFNNKLNQKMKRNLFTLMLLAVVACWFNLGDAQAKKVIICGNGSGVYHTSKKCKELKGCGLTAQVNEKDAKRDGKSLCSECQRRDAQEAADKAQKKAEKKQKKAENKAKKQQKKAKKAAKEQQKLLEQQQQMGMPMQ